MMRKLMIPFFALFLISSALSAETLTSKSIEKWLAAYPAIDQWMSEHKKDIYPEEIRPENVTIDEMMKIGFDALKKHELYGDFENLIKPLGYKSGDVIINDTIEIIKTFMAISFGQEFDENALHEIKAQLEKIDAMPELNQAQKDTMKEQLGKAMSRLEQVKKMAEGVSEENINALTPFLADIEEVMN